MLEDLSSAMDNVALTTGLGCLGAQLGLYVLFAYVLPDGPWRKEPGFTAHQVIALPLVCFLTYVGGSAFYAAEGNEGFDTALARVTKVHPIGMHLSSFIVGELVIWDTPTGLAVKSMRSMEMIIHHVLMAWLAHLSVKYSVFTFYTTLYFGAIELSSVPLALVDLTHPRHKAWVAFVDGKPVLEAVQLAARASFAMLYFIVRLGVFPYYMFVWMLPDIFALLNAKEGPPIPAAALYVIAAFASVLTGLQFYWGMLIFKQVQKLLTGGGSDKKAE